MLMFHLICHMPYLKISGHSPSWVSDFDHCSCAIVGPVLLNSMGPTIAREQWISEI